MEIYCEKCDRVLGNYPDEKIPLNVKGHTTCKLCGSRIEIFRQVEEVPKRVAEVPPRPPAAEPDNIDEIIQSIPLLSGRKDRGVKRVDFVAMGMGLLMLAAIIFFYKPDFNPSMFSPGKLQAELVKEMMADMQDQGEEQMVVSAIEEEKLKRFDEEVLKEMIDKTSFSVSTDENKKNINGFYLEKDGDILRMVTTDGHRLAVIEKSSSAIYIEKGGVILPRKGMLELRKILEEKENGDFFMGFTSNNATMKKGSLIFNIKPIEGDFPDYNKLIPKGRIDRKAIIDRNKFLLALKRVSLLSTDKVKNVKFYFEAGKLGLSPVNSDMGKIDTREEVEMDFEGEAIEIGFNAKYFIDFLEASKVEMVELFLKSPFDPCRINSLGEENYTYILMPVRL